MIFLSWDDEGEEGAEAADPRLGGSQSNWGQMSLLRRKKHWQSLLPPSPTRVMHQNQFCISSPAAKTSPAFNPSSVSPSSRDANTQMICTHLCNAVIECLGGTQMICGSATGLVRCTYYYSTQLEILVGTAQQKVLNQPFENKWSTVADITCPGPSGAISLSK